MTDDEFSESQRFHISMDYRRESRLKLDQTARITVLNVIRGPVLQASVLDVSGSGMRLSTALPIPCGANVEIETQNTAARGSVCRCEFKQDSYEIGVQIFESRDVETRRVMG